MKAEDQGRIVFRDLDGNLIMDRKSDVSWWDVITIPTLTETDARQKGVKILKTAHVKGSKLIECIVDYLKRKYK